MQQRELQKIQMQMHVTNVSYRYEYQSNGRGLSGTAVALREIWIAEVSGFCTAGNPVKECKALAKYGHDRSEYSEYDKTT